MTSFRVPPGVLEADLEDGRVLLNQLTGQYHHLNTSGAQIVKDLLHDKPVADIALRISSETGHPPELVQRDVESFLNALVQRGLLETVPL
jgi:hypothetical protein